MNPRSILNDHGMAVTELHRLMEENERLRIALEHLRRFAESHQADDETSHMAIAIADEALSTSAL